MNAAIVVTVLTGLSVLHIYWAWAGGLDSALVVPRRLVIEPLTGRTRQTPAFVPSVRTTLIVAFGLLVAAVLVAMRGGLFADPVSHWAVQAVVSGIALVFLARAVGDFKLVGFFKPDNETAFGTMDTLLYSPLCVVLGALTATVAWG